MCSSVVSGFVITLMLMREFKAAGSMAMDEEGPWLYRDGTHLSVDASLELTERFYALLTDATSS